jgi:hypothetical protein
MFWPERRVILVFALLKSVHYSDDGSPDELNTASMGGGVIHPLKRNLRQSWLCSKAFR